MILNYLDELLDNILNDAFYFLTEEKYPNINKNQDIEKLITQIQKQILIKEMVNKLLLDNKITVTNTNSYEKLYIIYYRYLYSYMFIYLGVTKYSKSDQEFTNLLVFTYNNYLENYLQPKTNNLIILLRKIFLQVQFLVGLKKDQIKVLDEKDFYHSLTFIENLGTDLKTIVKSKTPESNHNLIKILIIKEMYIDDDKWILTEIFETQILSGDYKYIDVYVGDYNQIDVTHLKDHFYKEKYLADEFITFIRDYSKDLEQISLTDKLDFLLNNNFVLPITDEFYRIHLNNETGKQLEDADDGTQKDNMKIKAIIKKVTACKDKLLAEKNLLWYTQHKEQYATIYNVVDELKLLSKVLGEYNRIKPNVQNKNLYDELLSYQLNFYFDFDSNAILYTPKKHLVSVRKCTFDYTKNKVQLRNIRKDEEIHLYGFVISSNLKMIEKVRGASFSPIKEEMVEETLKDVFDGKKVNSYFLFTNDYTTVVDLLFDSVQKLLLASGGHYDLLVDALKIEYRKKEFLNRIFHLPKDFVESHNDLTLLENLPVIKIKKKKRNVLKLNFVEEVVDEKKILEEGLIRCNHFVMLDHIFDDDNFTQNIFEFSKKFAVLNNEEILVCKSCGTELDIYKYVSTGAVDEYSGEYIITSVIDSVSLYDKKEYMVYFKIIKQLDKLVEDKISKIMNLAYITGSESSNSRKRESLLKDVIDLLVNHNQYLSDYILVSNKFRGETKQSIYDRKKYEIEDGLSFLFAFKLDNNILLKSSDDVDKYKVIKYHNILIYIILVIILDLTESNILSLVNNHKLCNTDLYDKNKTFFAKIKVIKNNAGDTSPLADYPIFCYLITLFACMFYEYNLYQDNKNNKILSIKMLIVSVVDLLNTVLLINSTQIQGKNYLYQVVSSRFFHKLIPLYSNSVLMKRITDIQKGIKGEQYKSKKTDSALKSLSLNKDFPYHYSFRESLSSYQSKIKYITNHLKSRTKDEVNLGELRNLLASYKEKKGEPLIKLHKIDLPNPDAKEVKVAENSIDNFVKTLSKFGRSANLDTTYAIIRFDYLGIKLDKPLKIIWEDLKTVLYESFFKQPVIYYQDQSDRKVYFNMKYLNLLGYKEPSGTYCNYLGANIYLEKELSLNQKLQYLGIIGDRTNIMESVKSYLTYKFPQLTPQDIENKIFKLGNVDDFTDKDIIEAKEYCLANLNNERDNNVKVCINRIKIAIYQIVDNYTPTINKSDGIYIKNPTLEDEYDPNLPVIELLKKCVGKSKGQFDVKGEKLFLNSEFLQVSSKKISVTEKFIYGKEEFSVSPLVSYLCDELTNFLEQNKNSNDNLKFFIFSFLVELLNSQFYEYYKQTSSIFFEKQLVASNYKSAYDKKLVEQVVHIEEENEEEDKNSEPDTSLDNDLEELIKDIDQEEGNFDIDDE